MGIFAGKIDENAKVGDFDTFPIGNYEVELIEGSVEATNAGDGELFKQRFKITSGEQEGRLIFGNMNLRNKNPTAENIGKAEFNVLRAVTGVLEIPDSELEPEHMFFKPFVAVVKIQPAKGQYEAKNVINWGATKKLFEQGSAANDNGKAPVAANDNTKTTGTAAKKPWGARAAA